MHRATISVFCIALAVGLITGSPLFYESARVLNKVEFSDLGIDGDRIDPLIEESEEEQQLRNITVSSHTDISEVTKNGSTESTGVGDTTQTVPKVTDILSNGLPDEEVTGAQNISTTTTVEEVLTAGETTTSLTPMKTTEQNGTNVANSLTSDHVLGNNSTPSMEVDTMILDLTTQLMPKISTKDIQPKEEIATVYGEKSITTNLVDEDETFDVTTVSPAGNGPNLLENETTSTIPIDNDESSDVTTISPAGNGPNLLENETTSTIPIDNDESSVGTTMLATEDGLNLLDKATTSTISNDNDDVTTISPNEDGKNLLEKETTLTISTAIDDVTIISPTENLLEKETTLTISTAIDDTSDLTTVSSTEDGQNLPETTIQPNTADEYVSIEDLNLTTLKDFTMTSVVMTGSEQTTTTEMFMESATETTETILTTSVQTTETVVDTTTSTADSESYTFITDITVTTGTDSEEFLTTEVGTTTSGTTSAEASSKEMLDSTIFATTETIAVTEQFVKDTNLQESTPADAVLSTETTESARESTVAIEMNITESVTAVETTTVFYTSEILDRDTTMAVSSTTVALTENSVTESETVIEISTNETTTVHQTTLRSKSFVEKDLSTITTMSDSNNTVNVEELGTTTPYSTSEFMNFTEASETTTNFGEIVSSTTFVFSEGPTVIETSASTEDITSSTFEITTAAITLQTDQATKEETVLYDTTTTESVPEETLQPKSTKERDSFSTTVETVASMSITTDSSERQMLTTGETEAQTDSELAATTVGNGLTITVTEENAFTTTEESIRITTVSAIFAEVDEENEISTSSNRTVNTAKEHDITQHSQTSTSTSLDISFEETSDSLTATSTNSEGSQQSTEATAISSETEQIEITEMITAVTFSAEKSSSTETSTTETYLPPMTDVSANDESFITSHLITQASADQGLEISPSATITILALVTASPTPSTTHSTLGLTESEHRSTESFSTESVFTQSIILEETVVINNEPVFALPDTSEDSASSTPVTTSPQLKQESSLNALSTPNIDSGSYRHGPHICFSLVSFSLVTMLFYHPLQSCRSIWL